MEFGGVFFNNFLTNRYHMDGLKINKVCWCGDDVGELGGCG